MKKMIVAILISLFTFNLAQAQFEGKSCRVDGTSSSVMIKKVKADKSGKVSITFANDANERVNIVLKVHAKVKYKYYEYGQAHYFTENQYCTITGTVKPGDSDWGNTLSSNLDIKSKKEVNFDNIQTVYVDEIELTGCEFERTAKCN